MAGFFTVLSILGIFVGAFMVQRGASGHSLGPTLLLIIGIFVVFKEILDIIMAK